MILADWAALAVDNARLHEDAARRRAEAERAVRRLEATAAIARAVGSETDLDRVLELIVKRGRALLDARSVVLLLVEGDQFQLAAGAGQVASTAIGGRFPIADSAAGEVLFSGRPERIDDVPSRLRISDATSASPAPRPRCSSRSSTATRRSACSPRSTASPASPAFGDEEERLFLAFAASAATAVATARSVAEERLRHSTRRRRAGAPALGARAARRDAAGARRPAGAALLGAAPRRPGGARAVGARGDRATSAPRSRACGR